MGIALGSLSTCGGSALLAQGFTGGGGWGPLHWFVVGIIVVFGVVLLIQRMRR